MIICRTGTHSFNKFTYKAQTMYNKDSNKDLLGAAVTAALGAGIVTSFAVSQGQNPLVALAITGFSVVVALLFSQFGLI